MRFVLVMSSLSGGVRRQAAGMYISRDISRSVSTAWDCGLLLGSAAPYVVLSNFPSASSISIRPTSSGQQDRSRSHDIRRKGQR